MRIEIDSVHKSYGSVTALDGVTFEIPSGSTFGLLGTNGAGKTTLFELLVGHDDPDDGQLTVGGIDVVEAGASVREHIGFLPEQVGFPGLLTGKEVLEVHGRIRGVGPSLEARIDEVLETVDLTDADRSVSGYSNGMRTRLGLAASLLTRPPVLILDEPTAGLDPKGVEAFHQLIERIDRESDATVIISSHALSEIERLCDEVAILHDGRLRAVHTLSNLNEETESRATVSIRTDSDDKQARVVETVKRYGDSKIGPKQVIASIPSDDVVEFISELDTQWVSTIEVDEHDLDTAFHAAIDDAETAAPVEVVADE